MPPPQPDQQRGQAELPLQRRLVHHLRDVPQVGEQPLAADLAEDPRLQLLVERHRLEQRRDPALLEHRAPDPQLQREVVGEVVAGARRARPRRGRRSRSARPGVPGWCGAAAPAPRAAAATPRPPAWRRRDVLPVSTTGTPAACSCALHQLGLAVRAAPGPRCRRAAPAARRRRRAAARTRSPESSDTTRSARSRATTSRAPPVETVPFLVSGSPSRGTHPQLHRHRRRHQPAVVRGLDRQHPDPLVAERCAAEDRGHPVEQQRVAAPVGRQGAHDRRRRAGLEVGVHVGAAEAVDGLLRVADQHQGAVAVERLAQDRPLHRVGVLELVDQHHPVARPQPGLRDRPESPGRSACSPAGSACRRSR